MLPFETDGVEEEINNILYPRTQTDEDDAEAIMNEEVDPDESMEEVAWVHPPEFDPFCKNEEGIPFAYEGCVNITTNVTKPEITIDDKFSYVDAFLQGFRYHDTIESGLNCS